MLNLQLLFPKSQPAAAALAAGSFLTSLNVQPASGSAAPTAPSDPFARTSQPGADLEAVRAGIRNIVETTAVDLSVAHSLALGNAVILPIQGTAFMIDKGVDVGAALLHIQDQTTTPVNSINVFPGDSYTLPFTFVVIENAAQAAKVLRIHYGTGIQFLPSLAGTLAISGNVAITQTAAGAPQGGDLDSINSKALVVNLFNAGVAAQVSGVAIANPAASGKTLYIDRLHLTSNVATLILGDFEIDTFFTDVGTGTLKLAPPAASTARSKSQSNKPLNADTFTFNLTANESRDLIFTRPFVLPAGRCLGLQSVTVQAVLNGFAEGREY